MYRYQITPQAFRQLDREIEYSKQKWGREHARQYKQALLEKVRNIAQNPKIFPENPDFGKHIRTSRYKGNYITYMFDETEHSVVILGFPSIYKQP